MSEIVPTVRPYQKPAVVSLTSSHVFVIDHPTLGMMSMSYADLRTQLDATYAAAQVACAASQSAAAASQVAAAASASTATTQASASGVSATAAAASQLAAAASETAAGISQTAAGVSASAAGASQTAAGVSATAALASQTAAAASEVSTTASAATALANANTAIAQATAASGSASAANASQIAAGVSAAAAAGSAAAADVSVTTAAASATASGVSATASSGSASTASAQAVAATNSANAAAASAANALAAISQAFKGGVAGGSVPATSTSTGDTYRITAAGTSQSKTWVIGDAAIYNGTTGSWTRLTGFFAGATQYTDAAILALAAYAGGYPNSDGATSNRAAGIYGPFDGVNNPREWVAGAASLTIAAVVTVPTSNPSATAILCNWGFSSTSTGGNNSLSIYISTGGSLVVDARGAASGADIRTFGYAGFRAAYSGQTGLLKVYLVQGSTNPVISWNGVDISSNFSLFLNGGADPVWLSANLVPTYRLVGYNWPSGPAPIVTPILGATSAADDAFYLQTGKWPAWVVAGGSAASLYPGDTQTFTSGVGSWSNQVSGSISASGGKGVVTGISGYYDGIKINSALVAGRKYLLVCTLSSLVGGTTVTIADGSGATYSPNLVSGLNTVGFTAGTGGSTQNLLIIGGGSGCTGFSIDDFFLYALGALSLPAVQPINVLDDVSGIGGNQGRMLGCTAVTDKTTARICANTWLATNQRILEGTLFDSSQFVISGPITQSTAGTPTTTIGSVSGGTQYKSSSALAAGLNPALPVTYKPASGEIWVNSNSTALVRTTIPLQKVQ